ncbi:hypothetical protein DFH27DRAFT_656463 [Peziza echinospora]|nr:hypothetical protein DFH27DRAFT_656463 [Peziza echinospora]
MRFLSLLSTAFAIACATVQAQEVRDYVINDISKFEHYTTTSNNHLKAMVPEFFAHPVNTGPFLKNLAEFIEYAQDASNLFPDAAEVITLTVDETNQIIGALGAYSRTIYSYAEALKEKHGLELPVEIPVIVPVDLPVPVYPPNLSQTIQDLMTAHEIYGGALIARAPREPEDLRGPISTPLDECNNYLREVRELYRS